MLEKIITYLNTKLEATNYFEKVFELAELVANSSGKTTPKAYCTKSNWEEVTKPDKYNGLAYWRKAGNVSIDNSVESFPACGFEMTVSYPMKFVAFVPKEKLQKDDCYSDDRIAETIIKTLTISDSTLKKQIGAKLCEITATNYITDNKVILNEEYEGVDFKNIKYKYSYLSVSFNFKLIINKSCLTTNC
jgi:hypothetical protein